ncbi:poly-beta-1,6-N-acetyl-D-glucosamine biosynthesis protein PgaD [Bacillus sp. ISL-45]|uniref:poly-beta-1,6-N-acetyl-D-glucosamine biosynthesis protein PgaD n=1 Tax=Bacillus sp. ISL-45 TaxID=2819128 RepID=UPI001BE51B2B|nr:poly-beta-1,6-N-acetyl-D-glucosamine biosynthesis protein PgaD [Bacillus sp. ISL-45]MBT2661714.1 poly-beta-1,6-N-acetyl-D-glucosamine biosynthesis protein PgaD [Bacillus sp. ISL-45]
MIINNKQSRPRKIIDLLFTLFGWAFLALFLYNIITYFEGTLDFTFLELNLANANSIMLITILVVIISAAFLSWWSSYNRCKYGALKRRTFPPQACGKEMAEYFQVTEDEHMNIRESNYIDRK